MGAKSKVFSAGIWAVLGLGLGLGSGHRALAHPEQLGEFRLKEFVLRPSLAVTRSESSAQLSLGQSSLAWGWILTPPNPSGRAYQPELSAQFRVGDSSLRSPPLMHPQKERRGELQLTFVEAFGVLSGIYGELSLGLLPLNYALEGAMGEGELLLPRSQLFSERVVGLRDHGVSWRSSYNGYFTQQTIHQGRNEMSRQGAWWYTGTWGWREARGRMLMGLSAQKARLVAGESLEEEGSGPEAEMRARIGGAFLGFDPALGSQWQMGSLFLSVGQLTQSWQLKTQWTYGRRLQEGLPDSQRTSTFQAFNLDLSYAWADRWLALARFDRLQDLRFWTAGVALRSHQDTSTWIFLFSEQMQASGRPDQKERRAEILWRIFPLAHSL